MTITATATATIIAPTVQGRTQLQLLEDTVLVGVLADEIGIIVEGEFGALEEHTTTGE